MYLESLWIQGFRALEEEHFENLTPITAVEGDNGSGKTTLLDAVYFLASGKSCLGLTNTELIRDNHTYFVTGGRYRSRDAVAGGSVVHTIQAMYTADGRKELRVDGALYHGFVHAIGGFRVAHFNFSSVFLVKGMPSVRRQYINLLIASCDRTYLEALSVYSGVIARKNALLRQSIGGIIDTSLLDLYDEQIVTLSATVYARRAAVLSAVGDAMKQLIMDGLFPRLSDVFITYEPRTISMTTMHAIREREIARRTCLAGCHLDDFVFIKGRRPLRETASLGEAKLVALLLTLSGAEYVRRVTSEYPVLLLDDLEGDIDAENLAHLVQLLTRFEQVFVASFDFQRLGGGLNATSVRL